MKRITGILTTLLFSLVIIWTSAGIGMLHCAHSGELKPLIASTSCPSPCCQESTSTTSHPHTASSTGKAVHCQPASSCMSVKVWRLAPGTTNNNLHFIFNQVPVLCKLLAWAQPTIPAFCSKTAERDFSQLLRHGPPRRYLAFLRILRI